MKIPLVAYHSKINWFCHGGQSFILIQANCDRNYQALKDIDKNSPEEEELVVEFIVPYYLTSIHQLSDKAVDVPLKMFVREEYHNHIAALSSTPKKSASNIVGDEIRVTLEDLVRFIKSVYNKSISLIERITLDCRYFQNMRSRIMV